MILFKCKMCGGDIQAADCNYGTCDSCGSTMTLPKASDERKANLYNRANHFRRQSEFDKAVQAYENILNEDNSDAEAHWGVVLSRYGIEYVEDPISQERIPTCHRAQFGSILSDTDYLEALENSTDFYTRSLYEQEAKRISEIQKEILAISAQSDPYDIFICYKETTSGGSRTKDSAIAQDIYYNLAKEGYKVFFSRITLEQILGQKYEPYIFSALNSAKVMLVVGTSAENFNAVWVRNEWMRFLTLVKKDRNKLLIPCFRDMSPYDLPEEFSMLQSQDVSKIGFMQDLMYGIKKVLQKSGGIDTFERKADTSSSTTSLLTRAFMCIEDGDFATADGILNTILNTDPHIGRAYVGKLLITLRAPNIDRVVDIARQSLELLPEYKRAMQFCDVSEKPELEKVAKAVSQKLENDRQAYLRVEEMKMAQEKMAREEKERIRADKLRREQLEIQLKIQLNKLESQIKSEIDNERSKVNQIEGQLHHFKEQDHYSFNSWIGGGMIGAVVGVVLGFVRCTSSSMVDEIGWTTFLGCPILGAILGAIRDAVINRRHDNQIANLQSKISQAQRDFETKVSDINRLKENAAREITQQFERQLANVDE